MSKFTDQHYLAHEQYRDDANLNARIALHRRFSINPYSWFRWVFDQITLPESARLLELGCGPGDLWHENETRIPSGWDITLSDLSAGMLQRTRARLHRSGHPFRFHQFDAQHIPFPEATFDAVIANHMLYHIPDRSKAFSEIRRVLKPGGYLYAALNGERHMVELADLILQWAPGLEMPRTALQATGMTLESAGPEFGRWFEQVSMREYLPNGLVITEAEPLIDYVRSMTLASLVGAEEIKTLSTRIQDEIATKGAFRITKSTGLFIACGTAL